jgi:TRAP-type mannitol/chloroaromatic compound transport system substrate-binding protein
MNRRDLLKGAGLGLAAAFTPARAAELPMGSRQGPRARDGAGADLPAVRWRLASSFTKSLDLLYGGAEHLAARVAELTQGKFQIRAYAGGEIVPPLSVFDKVQDGTVECGQTASYYYIGKNLAFAFDTALPFGLTARQQNAWMTAGGGLALTRELFKEHNLVNFPGGNTGTQMGGWFRREIKTVKDLKGLKMRIPGLGGQIMARLGAVPQTLAGADVYPSLEKGAIDATEWVGPHDDEKLGLHKIAKHYYYPGWWEGGAQLSFYVNARKWAELPKPYQQAFEVAAAEANAQMLANYDAKNAAALTRLLRQGVKLHAFPEDIMVAARRIAFEIYEEETKKNAAFRKIYTDWKQFRDTSFQWFKVAEAPYANFVYYSTK